MNRRLVWADSLKGFLILLVVLGHAIQYTLGDDCYNNHLWNVIYSFHMPAFMAVSGYLAYRVGGGTMILPMIKRRFKQLMIPYFLWSFLLVVINGNFTLPQFSDLLLYPDKGLWFLWALFFISVIFLICLWIAEKFRIKQEGVAMVVGLLFALSMVAFKTKILAIQYIAYYFLFYAGAYFFHKYSKQRIVLKNWRIIILALMWCVLAWFWHMQEAPVFLEWLPVPSAIVNYLYRFATAVIAIYILFIVAPKLIDCTKVWNKPFVKLGNLSLGIYTAHFIFIGQIVDVLKRSGINDWVVIILSFLGGSMISWLIVWLLSKSEIANKCFLGKV